MKSHEFLKALTNRAATVKVTNVMNPLLWVTALVTPTAWVGALISLNLAPSSGLHDKFLYIGACPLVMVAVAYFIWTFRDPNRLQSEEFQLRQVEMTLKQKGGIVIDGPDLVITDNPELAQIENNGGKK